MALIQPTDTPELWRVEAATETVSGEDADRRCDWRGQCLHGDKRLARWSLWPLLWPLLARSIR